ncbi:MAG: RNA polymerase sigma factor [Myxococcales bacterium]
MVRARSRYLAGSRFSPWLYAIAVNAARDAGRRKSRSPETLTSDGALPDTRATAPMVADPGLEKRVAAALEQLPAAQREAVVLHRFHGLSFAEIAEALGTTIGAAKVRAHRGYEKLRALLAGVEE